MRSTSCRTVARPRPGRSTPRATATRSLRRARSTRLHARSRTHATSWSHRSRRLVSTLPFLASNVRAARTLADIGTDLADAGESLTEAVDPDALEVVDGRLPLEEVTQDHAEARARGGSPRPRRAPASTTCATTRTWSAQVRDAVDKVYGQLARADREAQHAAAAARLAPAIFGADGDRTYLLVVQNNAESRATGGFIGSYALITAHDGKLDVGDIIRTKTWNDTIAQQAQVTYRAPADYTRRYAQYRPQTTLQNVNLSPDFPSVAEVLMTWRRKPACPGSTASSRSTRPGSPRLLQLTGPVTVPDWPTPIDSGNVVNVTLRDAYAQFAATPDRADFLGDVAKAAVDEATAGTLGKPAQIAKVLGGAAHAGHLILGFTRPNEEALADQLGVSGRLDPVRSDAIAVTSSNFAGNKIDYYLNRAVDYRVELRPNQSLTRADASANLSVVLDNTAPAEGLPQIVIGPYLQDRFVAGENRTLLSMYSPLTFQHASVDGKPASIAPGRERGRNVYSVFEQVPSRTQKSTTTKLAGPVQLHQGWYTLARPCAADPEPGPGARVGRRAARLGDRPRTEDGAPLLAAGQRERPRRQVDDVPSSHHARRGQPEPLGPPRLRRLSSSPSIGSAQWWSPSASSWSAPRTSAAPP